MLLLRLSIWRRERGGGGGPWAVRFAARRSPRIDNCPDKSWAEEILSLPWPNIAPTSRSTHTYIYTLWPKRSRAE